MKRSRRSGPAVRLRAAHRNEPELDASGCVVLPGFVDPHTHVIWVGDRAMEFEMRLEGAKYLDILAAGGGILSTVKQTRAASVETLMDETRPRLRRMFAHGTTTAEAKTGYGLEAEAELRLLEALLALDAELPIDLALTYLGAHAIPPEFADDPQGYTDLLCRSMLPRRGRMVAGRTRRDGRCPSSMCSARTGHSLWRSRGRS